MGGRESAVSKSLAQGRSQRYGLLVIWGAIIAVALFIFQQGRQQVSQSKASLEWPVTNGEILVLKVTTIRTDDGSNHSADIKY